MCQWCQTKYSPDLPWHGTQKYYFCYIKDRVLKHITLNPLYCSWFKFSKEYEEALKKTYEI